MSNLRLYECREMDEKGDYYSVVCVATDRKEAELKIHNRKWWQKKGIRTVGEFR